MTTTTDTTVPLRIVMDWLALQEWSSFATSVARQFDRKGELSPKQEAAARSMYAKGMARAEAGPVSAEPRVDPPLGLHYHPDGRVIRVITTRSSKQTVAKELVGDADNWSWNYLGKRGLAGLDETTLMTHEQATAWGLKYMQCVNCQADLEDKRSLAMGYGPKCAKNHGWPYPSMAEAEEILARRAEAEA